MGGGDQFSDRLPGVRAAQRADAVRSSVSGFSHAATVALHGLRVINDKAWPAVPTAMVSIPQSFTSMLNIS